MPDQDLADAAHQTPVRHEIRFRFDRALIGAAYRPLFLARGLWFLAIVALMVGVNWILAGTIPRLLLLTIGVVSAIVLARLWQVWRQSIKRTYSLWCKQAPDGEIHVKLDDDAFQVCLGTGSMRYTWRGLLRLKRRPTVWSLEIVENTSVLFPPSAASPDAREYVIERCRAAGVRV